MDVLESMKNKSTLATIPALSIAFCMSQLTSATAADRSISDFSGDENSDMRWGIVNDGVMGGLSEGKVTFTDEGTMRFAGKLSLKNNGGFSTVRTGKIKLDLGDSDGLALRVRGDGRTYQLRTATDAKYHTLAGSVGVADALKAGAAGTLQGDAVSIGFADGRVRINDATLIQADIECSNGIIHVIDSVLLPPKSAEPEKTTVISVAKSAGSFKTLLAAVEAAGLTETLTGEGPFTVLAPTDKAFAALPEGAVAELLKKENLGKLKAILTHHVVAGKVSAGDALNAKKAKSLGGTALNFSIKDGRLQVNGATIITTDIDGKNGVIHVIGTVLLPSDGACKTGEKRNVAPAPSKAFRCSR